MGIRKITNFLKSKTRKKWIYLPNMHVCISKRWHILEQGKEYELCFQIENVEAEIQGTGTFTKFINEVEKSIDMPIYIECIFEERFKNFFIKRGYVRPYYCLDMCSSCLYLSIKREMGTVTIDS